MRDDNVHHVGTDIDHADTRADNQLATTAMVPTEARNNESLPGDTGSEATVLKSVQSLGAVVGPSALITAVLFYFGWAKTDAFCQYFGIDSSMLGFSTQDYLLQSIHPMLIPLGEVLIAGVLLLWAHRVVSSHMALRPEWSLWRLVAVMVAVAGTALFVTGLAKYPDPDPSDVVLILTPLSLTLGVALFCHGFLLDRRRRHLAGPTHSSAAGSSGRPGLSVILVSALIAVGLVWTVANYADVKGRQEARFTQDQLDFQPGVVVYSPKRLHISAPGVQETRFADPESAYGYRYDGLKLLFFSNGRYFLVSTSWAQSGGTTIVLHDNDSVRVEMVHPK